MLQPVGIGDENVGHTVRIQLVCLLQCCSGAVAGDGHHSILAVSGHDKERATSTPLSCVVGIWMPLAPSRQSSYLKKMWSGCRVEQIEAIRSRGGFRRRRIEA
jgi:hypothetical protein